MRICIVSSRFLSPESDADRLARITAVGWAEAGHDTHVLCLPPEDAGGSLDDASIRIHHLGMDDDATPLAMIDAYPRPETRLSMAIRETLERLHARHPFDYIEFDALRGEAYFSARARRTLARFDGARIGVRLQTPDEWRRRANGDDRYGGNSAFLDLIVNGAIRDADLLIAPDGLAEAWEPVIHADDPRLVITPPAFRWPPIGEPERASGGGVVFGGPIERARRAGWAFDALAAARTRGDGPRVRIVGEDTDSASFGASMIDRLRIRLGDVEGPGFEIVVAGTFGAQADAAATAGVLCVTSPDPSPAVTDLIGAASGAAVVCASDSAIARLLGPDACVTCDPDDPSSLEHAIAALHNDGSRRDRLAAATRERITGACDPATVARTIAARIAPPDRAVVSASPGSVASDGPDVSIVITVYNLGRYLPDTMQSVRAQTHTGIETIVVDDGSTDPATLRVLNELERAGDVTLIRKTNGGLGSARNAGLRGASGRWVVMLDADDCLERDAISQAVCALRRDPTLAYVSPMVRFFTDEPGDRSDGWLPYGLDGWNADMLLCINVGGAGAGSVFDCERLRRVGGYDEELTAYEDWDLWCRLAHDGARGTVIPEFGLHYRIREDSMFRTEATTKHDRLKSRLIAHHAYPPVAGERTLRMQFTEADHQRRALVRERDAAARARSDGARHEASQAEALREAERRLGQSQARAEDLNEQLKRATASLEAARARESERSEKERARIDDLIDQLKRASQRLEAVEENRVGECARAERTQAELEAAERTLRGAREEIRQRTESLAAARDELENTRKQVALSEGRRRELAEALERNRAEMAGANDRRDRETARLADGMRLLEQQMHDLRDRLSSVERERARLESDLRTAERERASLTSDLRTVEKERASLTSDLRTVEKERASLTSDLRTVEKERANLTSDLRTVKKELAERPPPEIVVRDLVQTNVRYRLADWLNNTLKAARVQGPVKAVARRMLRSPTTAAGRKRDGNHQSGDVS